MKRFLPFVSGLGLALCGCSSYPGSGAPACTEAAGCGDGERCGEGVCEGVPPGSACVESPDCGNGQRCGAAVCAPVPLGTACVEDPDCGNLQRCGDRACVPEPPPGGCAGDADCGAGERCEAQACVGLPPGGCAEDADCERRDRCVADVCVPKVADPATCPEPGLGELLVCSDRDQDECPCYAGTVSFHEKDEGGRLSCAGVTGMLSPLVHLKQTGCHLAALDGQLTGDAVGFGQLKLRIANLPNDTSCSVQQDVWIDVGGEERPAVRITCSATCKLWMEQLPAEAEERTIPGGRFVMGTPAEQQPADRRDEGPAHEVDVGCFKMDRFEVSRAHYERCLHAGACTRPDYAASGESQEAFFGGGNAGLPMVAVDWFQAEDYCRFQGKSLPTEAEWERAARSDPERYEPWPWGATPPFTPGGRPDCALAMFAGCGDAPRPVGDGGAGRERGPSFFGVADLGGNVREWTRDFYVPEAYALRAGSGPVKDPEQLRPGQLGGLRVVRGGSFLSEIDRRATPASDALRVSARDQAPDDGAFADVGFRCVRYKPGVAR